MCFDALIGVQGSPHLLKSSKWGFYCILIDFHQQGWMKKRKTRRWKLPLDQQQK